MLRYLMPWQATRPGDVTLLKAPGRRLAKKITPGGIVDYDGASLFEVDARRLDGFDDLPPLLEELAPCADTCVIRGALKVEFAGQPQVLRRIHDAPSARPGHVITAPFVAAPRCWAMIDLEPTTCPPWVDPTDPVEVGGWLRMQLPPAFRMARCVGQLSGGAGMKPGLRCHLWFWLSRPLDKPELDRFLAGVPGIDLQVFVAVQIHYTAAPLFEDVDDPILERIDVLPGLDEVEVGDLRAPAPARRSTSLPAAARDYTAPARGISFRSTRAEAYMLKCLRAVAEAPPGARHPTIVRVGARLFGLAKAGALDPADVSSRIQGAVALSSFDRDHAEVIAALRWAWDHSDPWKLP
jgi:hypothetical protein